MSDIRLEYLDPGYALHAEAILVEKDLLSINKLRKELAKESKNPKKRLSNISRQKLIDLTKQDNLRLVVARDITRDRRSQESVAGMGTVYWEVLLSGVTAHIEDIAVDSAYQGQGIGKKIMKELLRVAKLFNASEVDLTSNPKRKVANILYPKLGFVLLNKETNLYSLKL